MTNLSTEQAASPTPAQLLGRDESALVDADGHLLHTAIVDDWLAMRAAAATAGFDLAIASSYRSFARQLTIWNDKATGHRPLYDDEGELIEVAALDDRSLIKAILRWSAIPGASRHHWGTDLDIYDRSAVEVGYQLQLSPEEVGEGGVFYPLHAWLDEYLSDDQAAFYRPYRGQGGIAAERWHLSHRRTSHSFAQLMTPSLLRMTLASVEPEQLALQAALLTHMNSLYPAYVAPYL